MAAALVSAKLAIPVVHVEAGLRSFDRRMPEEINRVVTDAISDLLLVTEASGMRNLAAEGIPAHRMHLVGNLMIDTLFANLARAREKSTILRDLGLENESFGLVTLHRPSNVDNPERLQEILGALDSISETLPLLFPVHPRTRDHVEGGNSPHLRLIHPLGYIDFLALMCRSGVVLTDSGGIQEETTALGVPCLTLRENTERPITVEQGTNRLAGVTRDSILAAWAEHRRHPKRGRIPPLWDGQASERSRLALREFLTIR
jgi:UDP-N-acetylglucosamine 2-epimerase (non-hydrolysing)